MRRSHSPLLRASARPLSPASGPFDADVAIIGGGLAGLACAVALAGSGLSVRIFESTGSLGGRARSWVDSVTGDTIDIGPHIFVSEYGNMLKLLGQLGTRDRVVWQTDRLIRLTERGRVTDMHSHRLPPPLHLLPSLAKVRGLTLRDKLSNLPILRLAMRIDESDVLQLDDMRASELLRRYGVTQHFTDWFWETVSMALMNVPLEQCSAGSLMRITKRLLGRNDYRIGFPDHGLGDLFVPQCRSAVLAADGRIQLNQPVRNIVVDNGRACGVSLDDGTFAAASYVVCAVPPHELQSLLPSALRSIPQFAALGDFEPSPYISTYLWFEKKITRQRFWSRIWQPHGLTTDFYDLSNIRSGWEHRPTLLASNIIFSHRAGQMSDDEIIGRTLEEAAEGAPAVAASRPVHAVVNRIPMAIACPLPGMEQRRPQMRTDIQGLLLAGDWTRTGLPSCMESAVYSGFQAAEALWRELGRPRSITVQQPPVTGLTGALSKAR